MGLSTGLRCLFKHENSLRRKSSLILNRVPRVSLLPLKRDPGNDVTAYFRHLQGGLEALPIMLCV